MDKCPTCGHSIKKKKETDPKAKELITYYSESFNNLYKTEPHINWAACTLAAKKLLKSHSIEDLKQLTNIYLESNDTFYKSGGYRFLMFPIWIQAQATAKVFLQNVGNDKYKESSVPEYKR